MELNIRYQKKIHTNRAGVDTRKLPVLRPPCHLPGMVPGQGPSEVFISAYVVLVLLETHCNHPVLGDRNAIDLSVEQFKCVPKCILVISIRCE